jgi:putative ABC transport system permease protein
MVGKAMKLAAAGVAIGVMGVVVSRTTIQSLLYGVGPLDPLTLIVGSSVLLGVALAAAFLPARRVGRVDPAQALRGE